MICHQADLHPPRELLSFVERQIRNARSCSGVERRSDRRYLMAVPVLAQPVDAEHNPIGGAFAVVTRDISPKSIGLVHTDKVDHQWLALQMRLAGELVNVLVEVLWCEPLGPFEYVGGRFVAKLDSFPRNNGDAPAKGANDDPSAKSPTPSTARSARLDWEPSAERNSLAPSIPRHTAGLRQAARAVRRTDPRSEAPDGSGKDESASLPTST